MSNEDLKFMHPYFLGAYAENDQVFERILLEFFRDHAYWRRNFHPENRPPIPTTACYREDFNEFLAEMQQELHTLSADLKKSVSFFSPRYIGHMAADLLLPGILAQIMTTLYNPNNVSDDAAPATLAKELEVGIMLARMFGFSTDQSDTPCAWGHLTSGGTVANYEGMWNFRAVKFYPVALAEALKRFHEDVEDVGPKKQKLSLYSKWELFNFSIRETVELMQTCLMSLKKSSNKKDFQKFTKAIMGETLDSLGFAGFFLKHTELKPPLVIVPISAHYSWEKATKILGFGTSQLITIKTDSHMRMRADHLEEVIQENLEKEQAVLGTIGVLGSTEFGSVDPIHRIVEIRENAKKKGFYFGIHVDAAWGGYMTSIFRNPDGSFQEHESVKAPFEYFPMEGTYQAFKAVSQADSVTVDPHKLGFLPFPSGAFVSRDAGVLDFICQKAAYVFDIKDDPFKKPPNKKLLSLGQYILEGSKSGAAAAAAFVSHRVVPLNNQGFGRILSQTMRSCEYFYNKLDNIKKRLSGLATIQVPFSPDTNLICYSINPRGNKYLALMNHFSRKVFSHMKIQANLPLQGHDFFGSFTSLPKHKLESTEADRILEAFGIDPATYCDHVVDRTKEANHIYMIRHTLMNPWLMYRDNGINYIDRYCAFLEKCIVEEMSKAIKRDR